METYVAVVTVLFLAAAIAIGVLSAELGTVKGQLAGVRRSRDEYYRLLTKTENVVKAGDVLIEAQKAENKALKNLVNVERDTTNRMMDIQRKYLINSLSIIRNSCTKRGEYTASASLLTMINAISSDDFYKPRPVEEVETETNT